jgi:hypothetical protein
MDEIAVKYRVKSIRDLYILINKEITELPQSRDLLLKWIEELSEMVDEEKF